MTRVEAVRDLLGVGLANVLMNTVGLDTACAVAMRKIWREPELRFRESAQRLTAWQVANIVDGVHPLVRLL